MMRQNAVSKVNVKTPKRVRIANIEPELGALWGQFNQNTSGGHTVMRACMSNLIIYCDNNDEAQLISQEIAAIVDVHPARVLLLVADGQSGKDTIEAFITLYYTALSDGWQVCAERIDVVSTAEATKRLPSVARSQLIGDLPTTLWWASRQPAPEAGEVFFQLAELADQIIYDNMGWTNPIKGVAAMTRWVAAQQDAQIVHNLAWRRFANWRKLISQVLDPLVAPNALDSLSLIEIDHGPHALAMSWLLVGWLTSQLQWKSVGGKRLSNSELVWHFRNYQREVKVVARRLPKGEPLIYRLLFDWSQAGHDGRVCFERLDSDRIGIMEAFSTIPARVFAAQIPERSTLVSAQLAQRNRDKIFENALKAANAMSAVFQQ
ncbi:MAG: glucose-6-phosphate dehydrogenase assembly protein OpcA [Methylococcales bacterium]|nr:glucose-6-phosphate dehydrogenase assembly protein OpcA [Methylococcales bacterium]